MANNISSHNSIEDDYMIPHSYFNWQKKLEEKQQKKDYELWRQWKARKNKQKRKEDKNDI